MLEGGVGGGGLQVLAGDGIPATVLRIDREIMTQKGGLRVPCLVAYYFVSSDSVVATNWERMVHDGWNRVFHGQADRWAYVLLQTGAQDGDNSAINRIQGVLDATVPVFQKPAPNFAATLKHEDRTSQDDFIH